MTTADLALMPRALTDEFEWAMKGPHDPAPGEDCRACSRAFGGARACTIVHKLVGTNRDPEGDLRAALERSQREVDDLREQLRCSRFTNAQAEKVRDENERLRWLLRKFTAAYKPAGGTVETAEQLEVRARIEAEVSTWR